VIAMSRDEFWSSIELCRQHSDCMPAFNRVLEAMLDHWELPRLAVFHKVMWSDIGVYHDDTFWEIMYRAADYLGSDNSWDSYGGWLIAQGRDFHEAVMRDPQVALTRIPPPEEVWEGESVIFLAQRVCMKKTDHRWGLYDLFGDDLSGKPLPGVDFPINW
jgi:Protein of unknown function (DUF4240)